MDSNPYTSPAVHADTSAAPSRPSIPAVWLGRVACGTLFLLASMYLATVLVAARDPITLTGMLGFTNSNNIFCFKLVYTLLLFSVVASYVHDARLPTFIAGVIVAVTTLLAVGCSLILDYRPSFYEWYVGETITVLASVLLAVLAVWPQSQRIAA